LGFRGIFLRTSLPPLGLFLIASSSIVHISVIKKDNTTIFICLCTWKRNIPHPLWSLLIPYTVHMYRILRLCLLMLIPVLYVHIPRIDRSYVLFCSWHYFYFILFHKIIKCICVNTINSSNRHRSIIL